MKQTKFTLANVLLILAAIGFGFACFLSINFIMLGNTKQSLIGSLIISIVLAGLAWSASKFKRATRKFKTNMVLEIVFLILFVIAGYFAVKPFSHVFTVFNHKKNIVHQVVANINQAGTMFDRYESYAKERERTYKNTLKSVVAAKQVNPTDYKKYGFDNRRTDANQIDTKMFTLHAKLFPTNYENEIDTIPGKKGIKEAALQWLKTEKKVVKSTSGFAFGIVKTIDDTPKRIKGWKSTLVALSQFRADGEATKDFTFSLNFEKIKEQLTTIESPTTISIILAILAYLVMLLPYFVAKRSTKFPGIKLIFGKSNQSNNEL